MTVYPKKYDVIVIGGGHAGVEAALAAARIGCSTLLLTINFDSIAQMSCNPAIGGLGKGQMVREIDALGGEMGKAADLAGIQFRMLNTKKGPSVWSPRAQCDKKFYQFHLKSVCERQTNLDCKQGSVSRLIVRNDQVYGVETDFGVAFHGETVIITTGTFLQGLMHLGKKTERGGRSGDPAAMALSDSLRDVGLKLGRMKTGTPPRLSKRSIDFSRTQPQSGDHPPPFFSYWKEDLFHMEREKQSVGALPSSVCQFPAGSILRQIGHQLDCYTTHTTEMTAKIVQENLNQSPVYSGAIEGIGPRYCPSIEDKIVKFPEKEFHQIFLEPEGVATDEIYVNGLSTSFPYALQLELVRSIHGCEQAEIVRPAYAVEYDFVNPTQLDLSLEVKSCQNLFLAGQINGTSGYEEAAAQGLIAGINAARRVHDLEPVLLGRDQAYIGVLIDDLTSKGTLEPYRMFTSRAEFRLMLRQDNADQRLSRLGYEVGLLSKPQYERVDKKTKAIQSELRKLEITFDGTDSLLKILRRPEVKYS